MTLTKANEDFMLHRSVCKTCGSNGGAVCRIGMELQRAYYAVIQEAARKLPFRSKAEQEKRQAGLKELRDDALLRRAAASRGTPEDIESWARKIGHETGDLND